MPSPKKPQGQQSLAGLFMWLPMYHRVKDHPTKYDGEPLSEAAYNHPVVVLSSKQEADGTVVVLLMTSFGGKTFQEHTRESQTWYRDRLASEHIPIFPSPAHGPHYITLQVCGGSDRLARNGYVITQPLVRVKFSVLVEYGKIKGSTWAKRLDTRSQHQLLKHIRFIEPAGGIQAVGNPLGAASSAWTRGASPEEEALAARSYVVANPTKATVVKAENRAAPTQQRFEHRVENGPSSNLLDTSRPRQPEAPCHHSRPAHNDRHLISAAARQAPPNFGHHYGSIAPQSSWAAVDTSYTPTTPPVAARRPAPPMQVERYPATLLPTYSHSPPNHRPDTPEPCWNFISVVLLVATVVSLAGYFGYFSS